MPEYLTVIGISHLTAPISVREAVALRPEEEGRICGMLRDACGLADLVALSTCSRFEVYGPMDEDRAGAVRGWLCRRAGTDISKLLYRRGGRDAAAHLFRVAAGLDSWVIGETEILGQVKSAYQNACREGTTARGCHLAFQRALNVGKRVRNETRIVGGIASIGGATAVLTRRIFSSLQGKRVLVFGAGEIAEASVRHLSSKGATGIWVSNRSLEKARSLASRLGGKAFTLQEGLGRLDEADIAVFSTGSQQHLLGADAARSLAARRAEKPLFIIDLCVPRNVAAEVASVPGIYLYDLDHLRGLVQESLAKRREDLAAAEAIVEEESADLLARLDDPRGRPAAEPDAVQDKNA